MPENVFLYSLLSSEFVEKIRSFHYIKYVPWDKTIPKVHTLVGIVFLCSNGKIEFPPKGRSKKFLPKARRVRTFGIVLSQGTYFM